MGTPREDLFSEVTLRKHLEHGFALHKTRTHTSLRASHVDGWVDGDVRTCCSCFTSTNGRA
eukprot:4850920-Lingulodinium_polyedra.AAC.1